MLRLSWRTRDSKGLSPSATLISKDRLVAGEQALFMADQPMGLVVKQLVLTLTLLLPTTSKYLSGERDAQSIRCDKTDSPSASLNLKRRPRFRTRIRTLRKTKDYSRVVR
jgi:hypothetical protein